MHQSTHGDSPMTTAPRASWRPGPGPPTVRGSDRTIRHGHISKMHVRAERAETADRRARRPAPLSPAHPAGCTPGDHAGGRPASGSTPSARHRRKRGAVPQQPPLAPPTSPTPELAHMAVRLWPIDRPASHAESAGRMWVSAPALLPRFCGDVGVGSGTGSRPDLRVGRRRWGCLDNDLSAGRTPACISPS